MIFELLEISVNLYDFVTYSPTLILIYDHVPVAQWLEHCINSVKGCGFNSQGTHILIKKKV